MVPCGIRAKAWHTWATWRVFSGQTHCSSLGSGLPDWTPPPQEEADRSVDLGSPPSYGALANAILWTDCGCPRRNLAGFRHRAARRAAGAARWIIAVATDKAAAMNWVAQVYRRSESQIRLLTGVLHWWAKCPASRFPAPTGESGAPVPCMRQLGAHTATDAGLSQGRSRLGCGCHPGARRTLRASRTKAAAVRDA